MRKNILLILLLLAIAISPVSASTGLLGDAVTVHAPAVSQENGGYVGVISEMSVSVSEGDGSIFVETWPLSEIDTQASARLAASVASELSGIDLFRYNFYYSITSNSSVIGGPSAGATLTVATVAAINDWDVDPKVMMTGMINPDGSVGPVGGIYEKAEAASNFGIKTFLVPEGQSIVTRDGEQIDLKEYAPANWGMEVKEVTGIEEAVYEFTGMSYEKEEYSGDIVIDTSFFAEDVLEEMGLTAELKVDATAALAGAASISDDIIEDLQPYLDSADERLIDAQRAIDEGNYYTAMSFIFQSRISYSYVHYAAQYLTSDNPVLKMSELLDAAESFVTAVNGEVKDYATSIRGYSSLEAFSAAQERAFEAIEYIDDAKLRIVWTQYPEALYNIAFATERARTAQFWLSISESNSTGDLIDIGDLRTDAEIILNDANLTLIYASDLMSTNSLLNDASDLLDSAYEHFGNENYAAALFNAIESKTRSSVAIELYSAGDDIIVSRLERTKELASVAIERQISNGITPVLSISYYEFASVFEADDEPVTAIIYYRYAGGIANAFKFLMGVSEGPGVVDTPGDSSGLGLFDDPMDFAAGFFSGLIIALGGLFAYRRKFYKQKPM